MDPFAIVGTIAQIAIIATVLIAGPIVLWSFLLAARDDRRRRADSRAMARHAYARRALR